MNNLDQAEFAYLLYEGDVEMQLIASQGGCLETYSYQYTIFIRGIQKHLTGCDDLDDFDGIHQFDEGQYVGVGYTLKEAWDDFCEHIDIGDFDNEVDKILSE